MDFFYDPFGRCVVRQASNKDPNGKWTVNASESRTLIYGEKWNLLSERTGSGDLSGEYVYGADVDEVVLATIGKTDYYPLRDGLGSTVAVANRQGAVVEQFAYSAFGAPRFYSANYTESVQPITGYRLLFAGREWLNQVGISDHRNRYYSASMGRWITVDPIRMAGGLNMYEYGSNDPINVVDPMGENPGTPKYCKKICTPGATETIYSTLDYTIFENFATTNVTHKYVIEANTSGSISGTASGKVLEISGSFESSTKTAQEFQTDVPGRHRGWYERRATCTCTSSGTGWSCSDAGLAYRDVGF